MTEIEKQITLEIATKAVANYAETHPRPPSVTVTQAAKMLNKSRNTVIKILAAQKVKRNAMGEIPINEIDKLIAAH